MQRLLKQLQIGISRSAHGIAPVGSGLALALLILIWAWPWLFKAVEYPEPVLGLGTWFDDSKTQDFRAAELAIVLGVGFVSLFGYLSNLATGFGPDRRERMSAVNGIWLLSLVPAVSWLGHSVLQTVGVAPSRMAAGGVLAGAAIISSIGMVKERCRSDALFGLGGMALLGVMVFWLDGLCLSAAGAQVPSPIWLANGPLIPWIAMAVGIAVFSLAIATSPDSQAAQSRVEGILVCGQGVLPLGFLAMVPPPVSGHPELSNDHTFWLVALVAGLMVTAWLFWVRLFNRWLVPGTLSNEVEWSRWLAPWCFAAAMALVAIQGHDLLEQAQKSSGGGYDVPRMVLDDYHDGEQAIPWFQLRHFGSVPYVDVNPILGLGSLARGALNELFFSGTMSTLQHVDVFFSAIAAMSCVLIAWRLSGAGGGVALLWTWYSFMDRVLFLAPALFVLCWAWRGGKASRWLVVWLVTVVLAAAYNPSSGVALAIASFPLVVWAAYQGWASERRTFLITLGVVAVALVVVSVMIPVIPMGMGFLRFIRENQEMYEYADGISASWGWDIKSSAGATGLSLFASSFFKFGWLWAVVFFCALIYGEMAKPRESRRNELVAMLVILSLLTIVLMKWSLTRIDLDNVSRTGAVTIVCLAQVLPVAILWRGADRRTAVVGVLALAAILGALGNCPLLGVNADAIADRAGNIRLITPEEQVVDAGPSGVGGVGVCVGLTGRLENLKTLKEAVDANLSPGETFYNMANRNTLYLFTGRSSPSRYSSPYYLASRKMQESTIAELSKVRMIIFGPGQTIGQGPISLRSMEICRWAMLHFHAVERAGWVFLFRQSVDSPISLNRNETEVQVLETEVLHPENPFLNNDLSLIPVSWGRSYPRFLQGFTPPVTLSTGGGAESLLPPMSEPHVSIDLRPSHVGGSMADYLYADLMFEQKVVDRPVRIMFDWAPANHPAPQPVKFLIRPSDMQPTEQPGRVHVPVLIPLSWHPRWLLCGDILALRLGLDPSGGQARFTVSRAELVSVRR